MPKKSNFTEFSPFVDCCIYYFEFVQIYPLLEWGLDHQLVGKQDSHYWLPLSYLFLTFSQIAFDLLTDKNLLHLGGNIAVNLKLLHNEVPSHLVEIWRKIWSQKTWCSTSVVWLTTVLAFVLCKDYSLSPSHWSFEKISHLPLCIDCLISDFHAGGETVTVLQKHSLDENIWKHAKHYNFEGKRRILTVIFPNPGISISHCSPSFMIFSPGMNFELLLVEI